MLPRWYIIIIIIVGSFHAYKSFGDYSGLKEFVQTYQVNHCTEITWFYSSGDASKVFSILHYKFSYKITICQYSSNARLSLHNCLFRGNPTSIKLIT